MSSQPLVSIVTPTLQRVTLLEQTLRSVRAQAYRNVEHIVIDGGSTDGTQELLARYAGTYNLRWVSEPDRGIYDAVNKGLGSAQGEFLAYLNSDDLYFPWTVQAVVEAFESDPSADLVYGHAIRQDGLHDWVVPVFMPPFNVLASGGYGSLLQPVVFMRRRVRDRLGDFDTRFRFVADMDYWLRAGRQFRFFRLPEFLAVEQRHAEMLSETHRDELAAEDRRMRAGFRGNPVSAFQRRMGHAGWHLWSARSWLDFTRAIAGHGGWARSIEALRPTVALRTALLGLIPSKASRLRSGTRWGRDPLKIAAAGTDDQK